MHRLGCPEAKGETALYAKIEQLQAENEKLKELLHEAQPQLWTYRDTCFSFFAKESHHKGNSENVKFWESKVKYTTELFRRIEQALKGNQ